MNVISDLKHRRKTPPKVDWQAVSILKGLRNDVLTQGSEKSKLTQHGTYQTKNDVLPYETIGRFEVYYQIKPHADQMTFRSYIYLRVPGEKIVEVPQAELEPIMSAICATFIVPGQSKVEIRTGQRDRADSMLFMQDFQPLLLTEKNPRQIVPGGKH